MVYHQPSLPHQELLQLLPEELHHGPGLAGPVRVTRRLGVEGCLAPDDAPVEMARYEPVCKLTPLDPSSCPVDEPSTTFYHLQQHQLSVLPQPAAAGQPDAVQGEPCHGDPGGALRQLEKQG